MKTCGIKHKLGVIITRVALQSSQGKDGKKVIIGAYLKQVPYGK
jgi:hypothetical protein